jgi:hypothetical protein
MKKKTEFDVEQQLRTVAVSAALGYVTSKGLDVSTEMGIAIGGLIGSTYDWAAFAVKRNWGWLKGRFKLR